MTLDTVLHIAQAAMVPVALFMAFKFGQDWQEHADFIRGRRRRYHEAAAARHLRKAQR